MSDAENDVVFVKETLDGRKVEVINGWVCLGGVPEVRELVVLDEFFETLDANTIVPSKTDYSYDIIR